MNTDRHALSVLAIVLIALATGGVANRSAARSSSQGLSGDACTSDADCSDGRSCNGVEQCIDGVCAAGVRLCSGYDCDEPSGICHVGACCIRAFACFTPVGRYACETVGGTYQGPNAGCMEECHFGGSGDRNEDGQVDLSDVPSWVVCFSGPMPSALPNWCAELDLDGDTRIDLTDFSNFQRRFGRCAATQDEDHDGVGDACDVCPATAPLYVVDSHGCAPYQLDRDADGVDDSVDLCPSTPSAEANQVDQNGCGPTERDSDDDGVSDAADLCPNTPPDQGVNADGCAASQRDSDADGVKDSDDNCPANANADQADEDDDGVGNACDQCAGTPSGQDVDAAGCGPSQRDTDGDGVLDSADLCPGTLLGTLVNASGCPIPYPSLFCGNGLTEAGEQCDPPAAGSCDDQCQLIPTAPRIDANSCANPVALNAPGTFPFDNTTATTDGPGHTACAFSQEPQISHDVWACWTAPCTATVFVRTLNLTQVDTKIAVYAGCGCPTVANDPLACNDDLVTTGALQSLLTFEAIAGQPYMLRLGTYPGTVLAPTPGGLGSVTISCGVPNCPTRGPCNGSHPAPGCASQDCCESTCTLDPYCCSTVWDLACVIEAEGICGGMFSACGRPGAGDCAAPNGTGSPGCDDVDCCNSVCVRDPFCCLNTWDRSCAEEGAGICHTACGSLDAGECNAEHQSPGCKDSACCADLCSRDPFCCLVSWDADCVALANQLCN